VAAEEAIQIGPLVLVKKPQYGNKKDYKYAEGGEVLLAENARPRGPFRGRSVCRHVFVYTDSLQHRQARHRRAR
jgi:hypothetical protein